MKSITKLTEENQVALREAGGIETVIRAINEHIRDDKVCLSGCAALGSINDDECKQTIAYKLTLIIINKSTRR